MIAPETSPVRLPAGRELDGVIAVRVMGWSGANGFFPSTRIADAFGVAEVLHRRNFAHSNAKPRDRVPEPWPG
jgi:hypothetical protein